MFPGRGDGGAAVRDPRPAAACSTRRRGWCSCTRRRRCPSRSFSSAGPSRRSPDLEEAAMVDGATRWQAFVKVVLPRRGRPSRSPALFAFMSRVERVHPRGHVPLARGGLHAARGAAALRGRVRRRVGPLRGRRDHRLGARDGALLRPSAPAHPRSHRWWREGLSGVVPRQRSVDRRGRAPRWPSSSTSAWRVWRRRTRTRASRGRARSSASRPAPSA
jgi:hypothetical protein